VSAVSTKGGYHRPNNRYAYHIEFAGTFHDQEIQDIDGTDSMKYLARFKGDTDMGMTAAVRTFSER